ncbi:hypothetical protein [White spot syndrome virus]|uniref:Uncharacterized protein n=1 Tax=White spot syndrome virus TaxID=342409 RepID=A0A0S2E683_9VIRU|nr:hypothetical protein [White spot syndrome virus]
MMKKLLEALNPGHDKVNNKKNYLYVQVISSSPTHENLLLHHDSCNKVASAHVHKFLHAKMNDKIAGSNGRESRFLENPTSVPRTTSLLHHFLVYKKARRGS